jgi:hypothetical protein
MSCPTYGARWGDLLFLQQLFSSEVVLLSSVQDVTGYFDNKRL